MAALTYHRNVICLHEQTGLPPVSGTGGCLLCAGVPRHGLSRLRPLLLCEGSGAATVPHTSLLGLTEMAQPEVIMKHLDDTKL